MSSVSNAWAVEGKVAGVLDSGGNDGLHAAKKIQNNGMSQDSLQRRNDKLMLIVRTIFILHLRK